MNMLIIFLGRATEIAENDVYICEAKYVPADHSLRSLTKGLKVKALDKKKLRSIYFNPSSRIFLSLENVIIIESFGRWNLDFS